MDAREVVLLPSRRAPGFLFRGTLTTVNSAWPLSQLPPIISMIQICRAEDGEAFQVCPLLFPGWLMNVVS